MSSDAAITLPIPTIKPPTEPGALDSDAFSGSVAHQKNAHSVIPGGAHTYAKGDDQMPEAAPLVIE